MSMQSKPVHRVPIRFERIGRERLPMGVAVLVLFFISLGCAGTETVSGDGGGSTREAATSKRWYEDGIAIIETADFERLVLGSEKPVVLEFFTPTCHACRMIAPHFLEMSKLYAGEVTFLKLNAKVNRDLSKKYNIEFTPVFIVFAEGKEQGRHEGHRFVKPVGAFLESVMD